MLSIECEHAILPIVRERRIPRKTRIRRTATDARAAILDAAEKRLQAVGPAGIRLHDVAADVGVSHPTVLHHFGSREALVQSVIERRVGALERDLLSELAVRAGTSEDPVLALLECVAQTLGPGGHARIVAWLALSGHPARPEDGGAFDSVARATHEIRKLRHAERGVTTPPYEDTYFVVLLAGLAMFGDAVAGPLFRGEPDAAQADATSARFRRWLAALIQEHLESGV
jgi:AcrR family transcriptional regulator